MNCKNCNSEITQNFCPICGQSAKPPRIDGKYILQEIWQVLQLEKGILYTIKELLTNPGHSIRYFIFYNRK